MSMVGEKINFVNLRRACQQMVRLIDEISDPATDSSGARNIGLDTLANEIRYELDGTDSCVPSVRRRALEGLNQR